MLGELDSERRPLHYLTDGLLCVSEAMHFKSLSFSSYFHSSSCTSLFSLTLTLSPPPFFLSPPLLLSLFPSLPLSSSPYFTLSLPLFSTATVEAAHAPFVARVKVCFHLTGKSSSVLSARHSSTSELASVSLTASLHTHIHTHTHTPPSPQPPPPPPHTHTHTHTQDVLHRADKLSQVLQTQKNKNIARQ